MNKEILEELKERLRQEKDSVEKELAKFASKDEKAEGGWTTKYPNREDGDKEEEADEVQEYDQMLALERSLEAKLKDIASALEKMEKGLHAQAGEYGKCEKCGNDIERERLEAMPEARLCMNCNK